jgi:hypothetical protein
MVVLSPSRPQAGPSPTLTSAPTPTVLSAAEEYTRAALRLIEERGLLLDETAWPRIVHDTMLQVVAARTSTDTYGAIRSALVLATGSRGALLPESDATPTPIATPVEASVTAGIGRIALPSIDELSGDPVSRRAAQTSDLIASIRPRVSCGWLVDVRETTSDSDWGALAALEPFSHAGEVFDFSDHNGHVLHVSLAAETAFLDGQPLASSGRSSMRNTLPVAVLQSSNTMGAGEDLILALRRGPRTRTFGATTRSGPTTETFALSDGARLVLPTTQLSDVGGWAYTAGIAPDVRTASPEQAAEQWLRSQCHR